MIGPTIAAWLVIAFAILGFVFLMNWILNWSLDLTTKAGRLARIPIPQDGTWGVIPPAWQDYPPPPAAYVVQWYYQARYDSKERWHIECTSDPDKYKKFPHRIFRIPAGAPS